MCFSSSGGSSSAQSQRIEKELKAKKRPQKKILLLGTGNSGKTTFCKQLTKQYGGTNPHLDQSNDEIVRSLRGNVLDGMTKVLNDVVKAKETNTDWPSAALKPKVDAITSCTTPSDLDATVAQAVIDVFADPTFAETLKHKGDYLNIPSGPDGLAYFVKNVAKYAQDDYQHTEQDLLRNRIKTTGIIESKFICNNIEFTLCDVAGQRSERRKWIHCFSDVSAIIYLTSVNEYDTAIEESAGQNSLADSIQQFRIISDLQCFRTVPFIVFLNKIDLLPAKLRTVPLSNVFKDYDLFVTQQPNLKQDEERAIAYFEALYSRQFKAEFCEFQTTCALDKDSCVKVFESILRSLINKAFSGTTLI